MAFRATQALRMVVKKTTTGLVGLAVDVNARANFISMQKQILQKIKVQLGYSSVYTAIHTCTAVQVLTDCFRGAFLAPIYSVHPTAVQRWA